MEEAKSEGYQELLLLTNTSRKQMSCSYNIRSLNSLDEDVDWNSGFFTGCTYMVSSVITSCSAELSSSGTPDFFGGIFKMSYQIEDLQAVINSTLTGSPVSFIQGGGEKHTWDVD